jgi:hypothetical protein
MKQFQTIAVMLVAATSFLVSCSKDDDNDYDTTPPPPPPAQIKSTVVSAAGDLTAALTQFRGILGDSLNVTPGKTSGRREVNWDLPDSRRVVAAGLKHMKSISGP